MQNKQPESYAPHMYEEISCNNKKEKYSPTLVLFLPITFIVQTLRFTHTYPIQIFCWFEKRGRKTYLIFLKSYK